MASEGKVSRRGLLTGAGLIAGATVVGCKAAEAESAPGAVDVPVVVLTGSAMRSADRLVDV